MLRLVTMLLWLVILAASVFAIAVHLVMGGNIGSVSLADLQEALSAAGLSSRWVEILGDRLGGVDLELILYGALALIGVMLIFRALLSANHGRRQRKLAGRVKSPSHPPFERRVGKRRSTHSRGLTGNLLLAFTGTVALFGICTVAVVYSSLTRSLREQELKRTAVMALRVTDRVANYVMVKKAPALSTFLRQFAVGDDTAYIVVQDQKGALAAHNLAALPSELRSWWGLLPPRETEQRTLTVGGRVVYEIAVPLADGQAGAVRVGVWAQEIESEIWRSVAPVIIWILAALAGALLCSIYLVWRINRPIVQLARIASHISLGALDTPLSGTRDRGEFGDLSRALERLRFTVKSAMGRLG